MSATQEKTPIFWYGRHINKVPKKYAIHPAEAEFVRENDWIVPASKICIRDGLARAVWVCPKCTPGTCHSLPLKTVLSAVRGTNKTCDCPKLGTNSMVFVVLGADCPVDIIRGGTAAANTLHRPEDKV